MRHQPFPSGRGPARPTNSVRSDDRGFALPVTIFALALMAVMITGAIFTSRQESRISKATESSALAFYLTERGINETIMNWDPAAFASMTTFSSVSVADTVGAGHWNVDVTKLGDRLFLLSSLGTVTRGGLLAGSEHRQALMARMEILDIDPPAALVTRGEVRVGGTAEIHGSDQVPLAWSGWCAPGTNHKPGVLNPDSTDVSTFGAGQITGTPAVQQDTTIGDATFTQFGGLSWAELVAMADKPLPGGTFSTIEPTYTLPDSTCNTSLATNWGDPDNPLASCGGYFPIVHINGNARMQGGGVGQGILLVDGNLDLRGGFVYYGIIIVQGAFETQGSGNRVLGGVFASNADVDDQSITGGSVTQNSSCVVTRALMNNAATARARPLEQRSWVDLTGVSWLN